MPRPGLISRLRRHRAVGADMAETRFDAIEWRADAS